MAAAFVPTLLPVHPGLPLRIGHQVIDKGSHSLIGPANIRPGIPKTISRTLTHGDNNLIISGSDF